jgi:hypothetical protein
MSLRERVGKLLVRVGVRLLGDLPEEVETRVSTTAPEPAMRLGPEAALTEEGRAMLERALTPELPPEPEVEEPLRGSLEARLRDDR